MNILVAVDGSAHALRAVEFVMRQFRPLPGAEAHVVNVQPPVPYLDALPEATRAAVDAEIEKRGQAASERARQMLAVAGFAVHVHVETGDPVEAIVRCAGEFGCDLVIMGTRGLGAIGDLALGSVASRVLRRLDIPVVLAP